MRKTIAISLLYAAIIFTVFGIVIYPVSVGSSPQIQDSYVLWSFNFDENYGTVKEELAEKYNNILIEPGQFDGHTPDAAEDDYKNIVTFRFFVPVTDGNVYGISCKKSDYALNVYVDGKLLAKTGNVSGTKEEFVPTSAAYEAFFTGKGDRAEIVIQRANFNHSKHYPLWFRMGPADKISEYNRLNLIKNIIIASVLLAAALVNIGMFFCFSERLEILWFSCICLVSSVNVVFPEVSAFVLPNFNWYLSHKLENVSVIAIVFFSLLYSFTKFSEYISMKVARIACIVAGACMVFFAIAEPEVYTRFNTAAIIAMALVSVPMYLVMMVRVVKNIRSISQSNVLALFGIIIFVVLSVIEGVNYIGQFNLKVVGIPTAISVFAFFNSLALAIDFRSSKELLEKSKAKEQELSQTNESLVRLEKIRETFMADFSHELKTPLTVIASNSALASKQVSMGRADENTAERLSRIEREAVRLGNMVDRMKDSAILEHSEKDEEINLLKILNAAADFCAPLCARNNNSLIVKCDTDILAFGSMDSLFHCLYNLISNATKHCKDRIIELVCRKDGGEVVVSVCDHGDGMSEDDMKHAFERGFSGDSSSGIGLSLCKELIENQGGRIFLEKTAGGGLTVSFTMKEAGTDAEDSAD